MTARKIVLLLIALVIGVGTFQFARGLLDQASTPATVVEAPPPPTTKVLVAAVDLPAGTLVKAEHLRWQPWPEEGGSLDPYMVEGERTIDEFLGSVVRQGLRTGEPISAGRLVGPGEQGFLAAVLTPGMRAVTVPVNAVTGAAGFIFPGDRVDLILTHQVSKPNDPVLPERQASETILTDLRVLAIDQTTDDQATVPAVAKVATLEVTPKDAEFVTLATNLGQLSLILRSLAVPVAEDAPGETLAAGIVPVALELEQGSADGGAIDSMRGYTWDSDVSLVLPAPSNPEPALPVHTIQVMRGSEATALTFERK